MLMAVGPFCIFSFTKKAPKLYPLHAHANDVGGQGWLSMVVEYILAKNLKYNIFYF
jgi:hypothetical protein